MDMHWNDDDDDDDDDDDGNADDDDDDDADSHYDDDRDADDSAVMMQIGISRTIHDSRVVIAAGNHFDVRLHFQELWRRALEK